MTGESLTFMVEKCKQYGLTRLEHDQVGVLQTRLEVERDSIDSCLFFITAVMQNNPHLTSSQFIGAFLRAAAESVGNKIVEPFLEPKSKAVKKIEQAAEVEEDTQE